MVAENAFRKMAQEDIESYDLYDIEEQGFTVTESENFLSQLIDKWVDIAIKRNAHDCTVEWLDSFHRKEGYR